MQREYPCNPHHRHVLKHKALAAAMGTLAFGFAGTAWSQATNGTIHGRVPVAAGESIQVTNTSGFNRSIPVGPSGKYSITLPVGTYTVSLVQNGTVIQSQSGVTPVAAGAVTVNFSASASNANTVTLNAVNVTANTIPPIDVTTTNQVTTITAQQLQQLPLGRTSADIAMLAPGVNMGSPQLNAGPLGNGVNVFGAASTAENAYYIDGMNVTDALNNQGGLSLPYGAIEQQQTFTSGYGAKYGRSIGGVINQIGKSGSNQWHFGARMQIEPSGWKRHRRNYYYVNPLEKAPGERPGDIENYNKFDHSQSHVYDVYISGPIVKDKLFFFVAAEHERATGIGVGSVNNQFAFQAKTLSPKVYVKLNWNINDNNILTLTGLNTERNSWGNNYQFDYATHKIGAFVGKPQTSKTRYRMVVANYTSYINDDLTLHAMVGKTHGRLYTNQPAFPGFDPTLPHVGGASMQNPAFVPPGGIVNSQTDSTQDIPTHRTRVLSYRLSLDYRVGNHDIQAGIDNIQSWDLDDGFDMTGPGYAWIYGKGDVGKPLFGTDPNVPPYVAPPETNPAGAQGYYVEKRIDIQNASVRVAQRAQYIVDKWQVTPKLLLNLGLRSDQFVNYNSAGVPYIRLTKPQWEPRLGVSWDVHGDSTLKVFANAGRYFLALPLTTATSISAPVTATNLYGTYTGIDPQTGVPIGFKPLPQNPSTGVSIDSEYGQPKNPKVSTAQNIKSQYSDNYALGMQQQFHWLGTSWVFGAVGKYQRMSRIINDFDAIQIECAAGRAQGYAWMTPKTCSNWAQSLILINPGTTQDIMMKGPDGKLHPVKLTAADQGFPMGPKRRYYSLDLSLTHAWDGKWFARFDYVFSKNYGNSEGPVSTYAQQSGSYESLTTNWDFPERMEFSNGYLPNDRRHQIKIYGAYAINPDWTVGANLYMASGTPRLCRGYYGPNQIALHGSGTYFWCGGHPAPPGSNGRLPWTRQLNVNVDYKPAWAGHKLDFNLAVFNLFNSQQPLFLNDVYGTTDSPNPDYGRLENVQTPRYARFSISYNY